MLGKVYMNLLMHILRLARTIPTPICCFLPRLVKLTRIGPKAQQYSSRPRDITKGFKYRNTKSAEVVEHTVPAPR